MPVIQMREALNQAMTEEMERDETVFLMGEEVGHYNGAYKVSQGMLKRFGEKRVIDAPIAESGFAGLGIGAAMVGLRPIIEFMTWNFSLVAVDQIINNAAKIRQMSGGQFNVPDRVPRPGRPGPPGRRPAQPGAGAHLRARARAEGRRRRDAADAKGLLKTAIRDDNPVVFIEGEALYSRHRRGPRGRLHHPARRRRHQARGQRLSPSSPGRRWSRWRWPAAEALAAEGIEAEVARPAHAAPARRGADRPVGEEDRPRA